MAILEANRMVLASIDHEMGEIAADRTDPDAPKAISRVDDEAGTKIRRANILNSSAPAYSIPTELLSAIFKVGHSENSDEYETPFELIVSQVSSRWRETSLNTPSLWTRIRRRAYQARLNAIEMYLQRSKAVHFELVIQVGVPSDEIFGNQGWPYDKLDCDSVSECCALVVPSMDRCNRIDLTFSTEPKWRGQPFEQSGNMAFGIIMQHFGSLAAPVLRSINVDWGEEMYFRSGSFQQIFTGGAPLLTSIKMLQVGMHLCVPPLSSVQSIHLYLPVGPHGPGRTCREFCDMLSAATSLLHLMVIGEIIHSWTPVASATLPYLQTLSIGIQRKGYYGTMDEPQFSGLLNTITAPSLELLLMQWVDRDTFSESPPPVGKFPRLQRLILERVDITSDLVNTLSTAFDSVRHLVWGACLKPCALLDADTIWPNLRTISIPLISEDFKLDTIEALSRKCAASAHPLEKIFARNIPPALVDSQSTILVEKFDCEVAYARLPSEFQSWSEVKKFA
ncbi:hypothetical protein HWV62_5067 [Athelia sp. TMB]|nr:hypothetical protein HWV62_5067 [Athelia sp. TMB]